MNQVSVVKGKSTCYKCGSLLTPEDKGCQKCNKVNADALNQRNGITPQKMRREEIIREKVRYNEPLNVEDFVSMRKLKELRKVSIMF